MTHPAKILLLLALCAVSLATQAQDYPNRPITLIVPYVAGGNTDVVMRAVARSAEKKLGQPIVVDNKPGASGTLGPGVMALTAKPDGYTIAQVSVPLLRIPFINKNTKWDPLKDFTYIANLMSYTFGIVAGVQQPFKTWQEMMAYAKQHPNAVAYATPGAYTTPHLGMEQISKLAGIELTHVPYKGGPEGTTAVLGGQVQLLADNPSWKSQVDAGKAKLLAVWSAQRSKRWPDVPTLKDLGYPLVIDSPVGIAGPKGMDPKIATKLQEVFRSTLDDPEVQRMMGEFDMEPKYMNGEAFRRYMTEQQVVEKQQLQRFGVDIKQ